ncbi:MAG: LiaI-LiaF-like domain-containing protein [Anaerolineales bacterium]
MRESEPYRYRSLFWPVVLIGAGSLWLLSNLGLLPDWSWGMLWRLWPLALIAIGLDLLIARRSPVFGAFLALIVVGLLIAAIFLGSSLGLPQRTDIKIDRYGESLGMTREAAVEIDFSVGKGSLVALDGGQDLFTAEIAHLGELNYQVSGEETKSISLSESNFEPQLSWVDRTNGDDLYWNIGLSPRVPVDLDLHGGVGETDINLSGLQPTSLKIEGGVGKVILVLPATGQRYPVVIDGDVGEIDIEIEAGALVDLDITGGVGEVKIDVPTDATVRLDASVDIGSVRVPSGYRLTEGGDEFIGESGVWESPGLGTGEPAISIRFEGGVGSLLVR